VDAALEVVTETGYAGATASAISARAGLSHGALFRHFPTMLDFMAVVAEAALERQNADFVQRAAELAEPDLPGVLAVLRAVMGSPTNRAVYQLVNAARTDPELATVFRAKAEAHRAAIVEIARGVPGLAAVPDDVLATALLVVTDIYDAAAMLDDVRPLPADELARRDALVVRFVETLAGR
jgi:AcrR family transcriptional regulator